MEKLSEAIKRMKGQVMFSAGEKPYITLNSYDTEDTLIKNIKFLLQTLN